MKKAIISGLIGATMGFLVSFAVNYFLIPVPDNGIANAFGNGISGLLSGFMGGFIGLMTYIKKQEKRAVS